MLVHIGTEIKPCVKFSNDADILQNTNRSDDNDHVTIVRKAGGVLRTKSVQCIMYAKPQVLCCSILSRKKGVTYTINKKCFVHAKTQVHVHIGLALVFQ